MSKIDDFVIIGGRSGGIPTDVREADAGLSYVILEKGGQPFRGIIDAYPRGKNGNR